MFLYKIHAGTPEIRLSVCTVSSKQTIAFLNYSLNVNLSSLFVYTIQGINLQTPSDLSNLLEPWTYECTKQSDYSLRNHFDMVVAKLQCACTGRHPSSDLHNLHQRGYDVFFISVAVNKF